MLADKYTSSDVPYFKLKQIKPKIFKEKIEKQNPVNV